MCCDATSVVVVVMGVVVVVVVVLKVSKTKQLPAFALRPSALFLSHRSLISPCMVWRRAAIAVAHSKHDFSGVAWSQHVLIAQQLPQNHLVAQSGRHVQPTMCVFFHHQHPVTAAFQY
jgi:hypothetical protein